MLPNPLHPALVHFPIVLILVGAMAAVAAAFLRRWHLPLMAAILLSLGALGALAAVQTGEEEGGLVDLSSESTEAILDEHEDWAETTRSLAIVAAVLAVASACLVRLPRTARAVGAATAIAALAAAYAVAQTGHYGGQLVYGHGVGVNLVAGQADGPVVSAPRHDDDD
jgi:uncharacterized membrane protein